MNGLLVIFLLMAKKNGLFTGNYDKNNGNALFMTKNGDTWSIPEKDCVLVKNRHNGKG